jgi:hypothetical protein
MKEVKDILKLVVGIILMEDIENSFFSNQNHNTCSKWESMPYTQNIKLFTKHQTQANTNKSQQIQYTHV